MITPARKCRQIDCLKARAHELGLCEYAKLYGDRRKRETWEKLLDSHGELEPLRPRVIERSETRINWQFAIASFVGAVALLCLMKPMIDKVLPVTITIHIGQK
jgi:hypothetical protein